MKRAYVGIRDVPLYRREAFVAGLKACGYDVRIGRPEVFDSDTVFVCWNRYFENHEACAQVEKVGGMALIAENGYVLPGGGSPHGQHQRTWFALARSYHNDSTVIPEGDASRWNALGVEIQPWRQEGGHVLVCPNRSFGTPGRFMPVGWAEGVAARLKKLTKREVRIRPHPGNAAPAKPLSEDLAGAWATVIWHSSSGVHSLVAGVPVICEAPHWIAKSAAYPLDAVENLPNGPVADLLRCDALHRVARAQFSLAEITSGAAFDYLLCRTAQGEVRAAD